MRRAQIRQLRRRGSDTKLAAAKTPMDEVFQTVMNLIKANLDKPHIVGPLHRCAPVTAVLRCRVDDFVPPDIRPLALALALAASSLR